MKNFFTWIVALGLAILLSYVIVWLNMKGDSCSSCQKTDGVRSPSSHLLQKRPLPVLLSTRHGYPHATSASTNGIVASNALMEQ